MLSQHPNYITLATLLPHEDYLYELGFNYILTSYKNRAPDRLVQNGRTNQRKAQQLLKEGGLLTRLANCSSKCLKTFSISVKKYLGLPYGLTALFDRKQSECVKNALKKKMGSRPYFAKLEIGRYGALHIHLIAYECPLQPYGGE